MKRASEYLQLYYVDPFARCPPYLFGILLGWVLNKTKNSKVYIKKVIKKIIYFRVVRLQKMYLFQS